MINITLKKSLGKEGYAGFRYLLFTRTSDGHICGFYGPYQGASNDLNLLDTVHKQDYLENWEFIVADGLFRGI